MKRLGTTECVAEAYVHPVQLCIHHGHWRGSKACYNKLLHLDVTEMDRRRLEYARAHKKCIKMCYDIHRPNFRARDRHDWEIMNRGSGWQCEVTDSIEFHGIKPLLEGISTIKANWMKDHVGVSHS